VTDPDYAYAAYRHDLAQADADRHEHAEAAVETFRAQRAHVDRSLAIDRTGWTRQQWVDDARQQMGDLDGSVMDLLNGHVTAMLSALAEQDAAIARVRTEIDALPGRYTVGPSNYGRVFGLWQDDLRRTLDGGAL
jgi:hypothetical protein